MNEKRIQVYLFRHGETDWNREGRFQGHLDVPLNPLGYEQALRLVRPLSTAKIQAIVSSDLSRALDTASVIAKSLGIEIHQDPRLREAFIGEAQGLTYDEIQERFGKNVTERWRSNRPTDADVSYPGGESGEAVRNRALAAIEYFALNSGLTRFAVSTHGGVLRRVISPCLFVRANSREDVAIPIPNGVLYLLEKSQGEEGWRFCDFIAYERSAQ